MKPSIGENNYATTTATRFSLPSGSVMGREGCLSKLEPGNRTIEAPSSALVKPLASVYGQ